jgi:hypothetical protein
VTATPPVVTLDMSRGTIVRLAGPLVTTPDTTILLPQLVVSPPVDCVILRVVVPDAVIAARYVGFPPALKTFSHRGEFGGMIKFEVVAVVPEPTPVAI